MGMPKEIWAWEEGEAYENVWSNFQPSNEAPKYTNTAWLREQIEKIEWPPSYSADYDAGARFALNAVLELIKE